MNFQTSSYTTGADAIDITNTGTGTVNLVYNAQSDSTYTNHDTITGFAFAAASDHLIDLSALNLTGETDNVVAGTTSNTNFTQFVSGVDGFFDGNAVALFTDATNTYAFVDVDGDGNFDANADLVIELTGATTGAFTADNFAFV